MGKGSNQLTPFRDSHFRVRKNQTLSCVPLIQVRSQLLFLPLVHFLGDATGPGTMVSLGHHGSQDHKWLTDFSTNQWGCPVEV